MAIPDYYLPEAADFLYYVRERIAGGDDLTEALSDARHNSEPEAYRDAISSLHKSIPLAWRMACGHWSTDIGIRRLDVIDYCVRRNKDFLVALVNRAIKSAPLHTVRNALRIARAEVDRSTVIDTLEDVTESDADYLAAIGLLWQSLPPCARQNDPTQSEFGNTLNSVEDYIDTASDDDVRALFDKAIASGETTMIERTPAPSPKRSNTMTNDLIEALRPFVEFHAEGVSWVSTAWENADYNSPVLYDHKSGRCITIRDFYRASAAFSKAHNGDSNA